MKGERPRFLVPLFSAALSALVVAGVYEVRARTGRPAASTPGTIEPAADAPALGAAARGTTAPTAPSFASFLACGELRRRYLVQCPPDLPGASTVAGSPAPPSPMDPRAAAELSAWLNPGPDELTEMARRCEVRFDMPAVAENEAPEVTDEQAAALSLTDRERDLLQKTLRDLHSDLRGFAQRTLAGAGGPTGGAPAGTLEEMLNDLQSRPGGGFDEAREKVAKERAAATPPTAPSAQQPPGERLLRMWATLGDQFERQLAAEVGSDRARQLRTSPQAGWMNRFSQAGCRSDSPPAPK